MLQKKLPIRRTYYNGTTYAIRPSYDRILIFSDEPNGKSNGIKIFKNIDDFAIELYLTENGYKEVENV